MDLSTVIGIVRTDHQEEDLPDYQAEGHLEERRRRRSVQLEERRRHRLHRHQQEELQEGHSCCLGGHLFLFLCHPVARQEVEDRRAEDPQEEGRQEAVDRPEVEGFPYRSTGRATRCPYHQEDLQAAGPQAAGPQAVDPKEVPPFLRRTARPTLASSGRLIARSL